MSDDDDGERLFPPEPPPADVISLEDARQRRDFDRDHRVPRLEERRKGWCRHAHVMVDDNAREIECRDCGAKPLDPYAVLSQLARDESHWKHLAQGIRKMKSELASLTAHRQRLRKNVRAVERRQKTPPAMAWSEYQALREQQRGEPEKK